MVNSIEGYNIPTYIWFYLNIFNNDIKYIKYIYTYSLLTSEFQTNKYILEIFRFKKSHL